jgi:hypothetical protein
MMQPKDRIEACKWDDCHMPAISHQIMNPIVHVFERIVFVTASIGIAGVRKGSIVGLISNELVGKVEESGQLVLDRDPKDA